MDVLFRNRMEESMFGLSVSPDVYVIFDFNFL